ncbi:MAG: hypothetical protein HY561_02255 [Gemmatimonadetes bacterium]|nr:hypothetical protein [Gemmatimonadota bacterium]
MESDASRHPTGPGPPRWRRRALVLKPLLVALAAVLLIFVSYEVMERTWLQGADMERLHLFHRIRGLLSSMLAAVIVGWLIFRGSPPLFSARSAAMDFAPAGPLPGAERDAHYAHWFIVMRWIAVIMASALVFAAIGMVDLLTAELWRPLSLTVAGLAALNASYTLMLRRRWAVRRLLSLQAYADLVILTVLLHFSGGIENPLSTLMLFHVIIAGVILTRRQCYLVAAAASALFGLLAAGEWSGVLEHYTLGAFPHFEDAGGPVHAAHDATYALSRATLQAAILFLTAYFATTITEQLRRDERQLEIFADRMLAQSQLLAQALETTGTGLCVCDNNLASTWTNRRWDSWFGAGRCRVPAAVGREATAADLLGDEAARVTEIALELPGEGAGAASARRVFQLTTAPLVDQEGAATHVVQLARDVTQEKQIQAGMLRAEKLAAVGELAGKVAHDINNPIAIISAKARLLLSHHRTQLTPKTVEELTKITELADRVARIAQGLLSYSRPAIGSAAPVDIRVPLRKALAIVEPAASAAGVRIRDRLSEALPDVRVNAGEMEQVFLNLLLNSLDAMPGGGELVISGQPENRSAHRGAVLSIVVEDTGCGISEEIRERVFEPFVTTKEEGKGTGLGLSICLGLVRSNRGEIELESEPGRGTRVRLRFPIDGPPPEVMLHA